MLDVPHEEEDSELAKHGDVELDVYGVGVDVASDSCWGEETSGTGVAAWEGEVVGLGAVDGTVGVFGADS